MCISALTDLLALVLFLISSLYILNPCHTTPYYTSCSIDKSYLVDVVTKLYIATDSNPVDVRTYELCSDLVDVRTLLYAPTCRSNYVLTLCDVVTCARACDVTCRGESEWATTSISFPLSLSLSLSLSFWLLSSHLLFCLVMSFFYLLVVLIFYL